MNNSEKSASPLEVYRKIKQVCEAHIGIASFDSGDATDISANQAYYPLAYLEESYLIENGERGRTHTYQIALNILDRIPKTNTKEDRIVIQDKCFQLFNEIYQYLIAYVFGEKRVGGFSIALTPDFSNDDAMRLRTEFTVTVGNPFSLATPPADLLALFPTLVINE